MRYLRKLTALILSIIFCAALIIGLLVILAVKNVNVEFVKYSAEDADENIMRIYEESRENLDKIKGSNMLFLTESDLQKHISNSDYIYIESYEKVYPCTINLVLKERMEAFAIEGEDGYSIYDETGRLLRKSKVNVNSSDNCPNLVVKAQTSQMPTVATLCSYFKKDFSSIRNYLSSVAIDDSIIDETSTFTFNFYSGISIVIVDYDTLAEEKIWAAYVEYCSLSDAQKLKGAINVVSDGKAASSINAVYIV